MSRITSDAKRQAFNIAGAIAQRITLIIECVKMLQNVPTRC
jgi:hypothetical protein